MSEPKALLAAIPTAAVLVDAQGTISACNLRFSELFGYPIDELLGQPIEILLPPASRSRHHAQRQQKPNPEARVMAANRVFPGQRKDGTLLELQIGLQPFEIGEQTGSLAILVDVSEERRMARALQVAHHQAEAANAAKNEFLATLSHEIRTPMHAIVGTTGLLLESQLPKAERELADTIQQACDSMLTLVSDLLDFSLLESGNLVLEPSEFELYPIIEQALEQVANRAQTRTLEISGFVPRHLPTMLRGDANRIRQVLLHLLSHALTFAERGELSVEAKKVAETSRTLRLRLEILDFNQGLTQAATRHVTGSFASGPLGPDHQSGRSLGIDLCRRIVGMMGGELGVSSAPGRGNRFWFEVEVEKLQAPNANRYMPPDLGGARVLLVEDHPQARRALSHLLASASAQVELAAGGQEAIARLARSLKEDNPPALVLASASLPDMDVLTLAKRLRACAPDQPIPVVRLGATPGISSEDRVLFASQLKKPVRRDQLYRVVLEALGQGGTAERSPRRRLGPKPSRERRILIAEDNPVSQRVAARMLENLGYQVEVVADGHQAVAATAERRFDLVLMDVQMPEMDGLTATKEIRRREAKKRESRMRIVAMTASAWTGDRERCLAAGMDDYLSKPVQAAELDKTLRHWLSDPQPPTLQASADPKPPGPQDPADPGPALVDQLKLDAPILGATSG